MQGRLLVCSALNQKTAFQIHLEGCWHVFGSKALNSSSQDHQHLYLVAVLQNARVVFYFLPVDQNAALAVNVQLGQQVCRCCAVGQGQGGFPFCFGRKVVSENGMKFEADLHKANKAIQSAKVTTQVSTFQEAVKA